MNDLKAKQKHITFLFSNSNKAWLEIAIQSQNQKAGKISGSSSDWGEDDFFFLINSPLRSKDIQTIW